MGYYELSYRERLKQQARQLFAWLERCGRDDVTKTDLTRHSGLLDRELQTLIAEKHMPRHDFRRHHEQVWRVKPLMKALARYVDRWDWLVD
ncbi:hypothetical protein OZX62_01625 [Bifidobacterium sp. ESL0690]|uniref:hypothetical protein n=1 Tax=Bifidobacterium sp. ESL0690 TaxID=2983214 RepID=UPI0023F89A4A|nr:hypothetical protein [Bifidobacterium sp. ESL0690]WEV47023.1 hypothetical protein OZX62_01625 [Bifidobacterium sp. ESL0690]